MEDFNFPARESGRGSRRQCICRRKGILGRRGRGQRQAAALGVSEDDAPFWLEVRAEILIERDPHVPTRPFLLCLLLLIIHFLSV